MAAIVLLLLMLTSKTSAVLAYIHPIRNRLASTSIHNQRYTSPTIVSSTFQRRGIISLSMTSPDTSHPYQPPLWATNVFKNIPKHGRLHLANLPTPLHLINTKSSRRRDTDKHGILSKLDELNIQLYIKRDDATGGTELGGNKVRKLEFLLADALSNKECDSVVTIGGEQSNHCRATAAASRMVGLEPHLILRTRRADAIHNNENEEIGWVGNVLFDRMVGSTIYTCTPGEYGRLGSNNLVDSVCEHLKTKQKLNPYAIPVGGSNAVGTWGYINGVDELMQQIDQIQKQESDFALDHVVFATGSGGTATGIAVGLSLAYGSADQTCPEVHAVGVCDSPDYFYQTMSSVADDMGLDLPSNISTEQFIRESVTVHHGKGKGYAFSSDEELDFIPQFATETGISLDPVYSGKALYYFIKNVIEEEPEKYRNKSILFWHTGGSIGLYEKGDDLSERFSTASLVKRLDAYGKMEANDDDVVPI